MHLRQRRFGLPRPSTTQARIGVFQQSRPRTGHPGCVRQTWHPHGKTDKMIVGQKDGQGQPSRLWSSGGVAERVDDAALELVLLPVWRHEA